MNFKLFLIILIFSLNFVNAQKKDSIIFQSKDYKEIKGKIRKVSFQKLLENPKKYNKKVVEVFGFLSLNKNDSKHEFYMDRDSYNTKKITKGILYYQFHEDSDQILKKFNNEYAFVTGVFVNIENEKFKNGLINIYRIENNRKIIYCR